MSQKKVDEYKERKANREKIYKKEKRVLFYEKLAALAVCLAAAGWLGYSIYGMTQRNAAAESATIDVSAIDGFMNEMAPETLEEE